MSTLLGSMNARGSGPTSRPSHPVDAALWGLAERLAGGPEPATLEAEKTIDVDSVAHQASQVRVVRLPQRAGGLPSVGRMGQRNRAVVAPAIGVPTKPISSGSVEAQPKPAVLPGKNARRKQAEASKAPPQVRRAEFTILKGRNAGDRSAAAKSGANPEIDQESTAADEHPPGDRPTARRRAHGKRRPGVTIFGLLALTALAIAAAAIALFAPSWF